MAFINENIEDRAVTSILSDSFVDYSMSVIVSRALPDVRDGLKPVHRRILHAMNDLNMTADKPHKKSARIVGEVIGKYHPHGDTAVYDTLVRMAQEWNMREKLIDMHGNNGSMEGDKAAAMRYTEARLSKLSDELLRDLHPEVVDYQNNFDENETEPTVLPSRFPNLLVNGSEGIAVGMATKIPPHNLSEVCRAVVHLIDNPDISIEELMQYIKGPDFPTGALIMGTNEIKDAYNTGKGSIVVRGVVDVKTVKGYTKLIIRELPYQVNPKKLVQDIIKIQDDWKLYLKERTKKKSKAKPKGLDFVIDKGVKDLTDQSNDKNSVTIEVTLKKDANPDLVLNYLYKHTQLQTTFPMNNLALVPRTDSRGEIKLEPKVLNLKDALSEYIKHQKEVVTRKLELELKKNKKRIYLLNGLIKALDKIDDTIKTIRESKSKEEAIENLINLLTVERKQAENILERRLQTLANFEQDRLREEHDEIAEIIKEIQKKLADETLILKDIKDYLAEVTDKYGNDRRTKIMPPADVFNAEDLIIDDDVVVTITQNGFIKRTLESTYRTQRRKGIGVNGMTMYDDDFIRHLHLTKNKDTLLFFTDKGKVYEKKVYEIPEALASSRGQNVRIFLDLEKDERIQAVYSIREFSDEQFIAFVTKKGWVKKSKLSDYANIRQNGIKAITLNDDDRLIGVQLTNGKRNITLVTKKGMSITFEESSVKSVGRTGKGVKGISLSKQDEVVSFAILENDADIFIATNQGYGKRTPISEFRVQKRAGKGVIAQKLTDKNGKVVGTSIVQEDDTLMFITRNGTLMKVLVKEISQFARNTQGTRVINLRGKDELYAIARIPDDEDVDLEDIDN